MPILSASEPKSAPAPAPELKPIKPAPVQPASSGEGKFANLVQPKVVTVVRRKRKAKVSAATRARLLAARRKKSTASRMRAQPLLTVVPKTVAKVKANKEADKDDSEA